MLIKGTHNGTVKGFKYFSSINNQKCCSLVLIQKVKFGESFLRCFIRKYFKDKDGNELLAQDDNEMVKTILQIQKSIEDHKNGR